MLIIPDYSNISSPFSSYSRLFLLLRLFKFVVVAVDDDDDDDEDDGTAIVVEVVSTNFTKCD